MNYGNIKNCDVADGPGVRISLFVSGCTHHCKGCFNAQTWDFSYGEPYTPKTEDYLLSLLKPDYVQGITLLGGEPFEPENQRVLVGLLRRIRREYPNKNVWCYTGYTYETDLIQASRARCEVTDEMLSMIDVLVDGEFVEEKRNLMLKFRGSSNQRIIDIKATEQYGKTILLD